MGNASGWELCSNIVVWGRKLEKGWGRVKFWQVIGGYNCGGQIDRQMGGQSLAMKKRHQGPLQVLASPSSNGSAGSFPQKGS